jgi:catechol 2,3-dioxygenase-like lactoylglutathione lyase family enzyme
MPTRLDHANINVRDIDAEIQFLLTAFPDFHVRHDGIDDFGRRWVHVGSDEGYIALYPATAPDQKMPYDGRPGVNHLGFEVEDAAALRNRLSAAGYRQSTVPNHHPYRTRVYFFDPEGNDWEFVQYLTEDSAKRHDYALPG